MASLTREALLQLKQGLKAVATAAIEAHNKELSQLSDSIWRQPELNFKEFKAHELLTGFLEKKGFSVERSYTGIETAFRATFGSGRPNVCVICEYDALPEIGHACGHNLIAEAGVAAGLGLKAVLESSDAPKGRLTVMGTPAEEGGGGKVSLIKNGAFDDVDVAMMVHPSNYYIVAPTCLALANLEVTYTGKAAHAAAFPWEGVNALDAAVMAYSSISVLRQQMKPSWRVHGVITNGGAKPNIIPEKASLSYYVRTPYRDELSTLMEKVRACFEAAAKATGCKVEFSEEVPQYDNLVSNETLVKLFGENLQEMGTTSPVNGPTGGSTDMGNVSHTVPSIQPKFLIGSGKAAQHTRDFARESNTPESHKETLLVGKAMAHTCVDVLTTEGLLEKIRADFDKQMGN